MVPNNLWNKTNEQQWFWKTIQQNCPQDYPALKKEEKFPSWHPFWNTTVPQKDHLKAELLPALLHFISAKANYLHCSLCPVSLVLEVIVYEYQRLHMLWCYLNKGKPEFTCLWATKSRILPKFCCKLLPPIEHILFLVYLITCLQWSLFTGWFLEQRRISTSCSFPEFLSVALGVNRHIWSMHYSLLKWRSKLNIVGMLILQIPSQNWSPEWIG